MVKLERVREGAAGRVPDIDLRLRDVALRAPERVALACGVETLSWGAFNTYVSRIANALIAVGVGPGDKVALLGRNSIPYVLAMFGALRAGACFVPLSTLTSGEALTGMIRDSGARCLFLSGEFREILRPELDSLRPLMEQGVIDLEGTAGSGMSLEDFIRDAPVGRSVVDHVPEQGFNLIYSSGTTGVPKGILQSRAYRALEAQHMIEGFGLDGEAHTIVATPLYSNTTLFLFLAVMAAGGSATLMPKFSVGEFLRLCGQTRPTHQVLVPVQYERLLASEDFGRADLSSFREKFCTSAPLRTSVKREILDRWPAGGLTEFYGMTEGGVSCMLRAHERPDKLNTVGQPSHGCELRILDDEGEELGTGMPGEIVARSDKMMSGYHNRPDATREASWFDADGVRFQRSGDIGWLDEEGFLHLLDRKKDVIISGGFNIYAVDLEAVLLSCPGVADAAVVAAPSERWGETPVAFVVLEEESSLDPETVRQAANAGLGKAQQIGEVRLIDALPRSPIGKILKRELKARLQ
ncbi:MULTISPECIES: class I adenylate-forming enzyme family protein [Kordiimonas]|jgi:acyl-CoA synthetase (AMP-forming)/AMP-acid ligase II|uniref:class I adenylate-forming enzyme family protein n=1 Tax=Kordiimonas TaxID=288021 RepID=UPI00257E43FD|nr:class I adenylate-forming enzyme family protein [Kordiimonas sp. UBA4487]